MVKVLFFRAKVSALAKVVIGKHAAAALYGANWKSRNFLGIVLQQVVGELRESEKDSRFEVQGLNLAG